MIEASCWTRCRDRLSETRVLSSPTHTGFLLLWFAPTGRRGGLIDCEAWIE